MEARTRLVFEIEPPIDQRLTKRARVAEKDANLAVLDPPGRPGILPSDADQSVCLSSGSRSHQPPAHRADHPAMRSPPHVRGRAASPRSTNCAPAVIACDRADPGQLVPPSASPSCALPLKEARR